VLSAFAAVELLTFTALVALLIRGRESPELQEAENTG